MQQKLGEENFTTIVNIFREVRKDFTATKQNRKRMSSRKEVGE